MHLTVVELSYETAVPFEERVDTVKCEVRRDKRNAHMKEYKKLMIKILKDGPSEERKFLRWEFLENYTNRSHSQKLTDIVENGGLEVVPGTSLAV